MKMVLRLVLKFVYRCPSASVVAHPMRIKRGEKTTLTWEWAFAERIFMYENDEKKLESGVPIAEKKSSEYESLPTKNTTYKIEAYGAENCHALAQTTVEVIVPEKPPADIPEQPELVEESKIVELRRFTPLWGPVQYLGQMWPVKTGVVKSITNPSSIWNGIIIHLAAPNNCTKICITLLPEETTDKCYGGLPLDKGLSICAFAATISGYSFSGDVAINVTYTYIK